MNRYTRLLLGQPFHPWLVGAFPILYLYTANYGLVIDQEVPAVIVGALALIAAAFFAANALIRHRHTTAALISIVCAAFSLSGHLHSLLVPGEPLSVWTLTVLIGLMAASVQMRKSAAPQTFEAVTPTLNLISLVATLLQVAALAGQFSQQSPRQLTEWTRDDNWSSREVSQKLPDSPERPDVYYIIPDAYPSDYWLLTAMDYDNSAFSEALEARGFAVARRAQSNYGITLLSLAATLNMRYYSSNPTPLREEDYLRLAIANSEVARYSQGLGYTYAQLLSGYLIPSALADINREFTPDGAIDVRVNKDDLSLALTVADGAYSAELDIRRFYKQPFLPLYLETTWLKPFASRLESLLQRSASTPYGAYAPERFLATIDEVEAIAAMPEATFSIIHLLKPHRPATFNERGEIIDPISRPRRHEHLAEFGFVNRKFLEMIDTILHHSAHPPIIIFQADHGSTHGSVRAEDGRLIHFDVYAAYRLPSQFAFEIPRPYTLVNAFPLILNAVFDAGFELNGNRLYEAFASYFDQTEVTETFARW